MNRKYQRQTRKIEADAYRARIMEKFNDYPTLHDLQRLIFTASRRRFMGEVLRDTIFHYGRWPNRYRGVGEQGSCTYYNPFTKAVCAVGRLSQSPRDLPNVPVHSFFIDGCGFDFKANLKSEYRNLPHEFFIILQMFHDNHMNWNASELPNINYLTTGITEEGKLTAAAILVACGYTVPGAIRAITFWSEQLEQVIAGYKSYTTHHSDPVPLSLQRLNGDAPAYIVQYKQELEDEREAARKSGAGPISIAVSLPENEKSN